MKAAAVVVAAAALALLPLAAPGPVAATPFPGPAQSSPAAAPAAELAPADVAARVRLEPAVAGRGEPIVLTLSLDGAGYQQPRLRPSFELDNLEIAGPPATRQDVRFTERGSRWSYTWRWRLQPLASGPAAVRRLRVLVGAEELELPDRSIEVDLARAPAALAAAEPPASAPPPERRSRLQELLDRALPGRGEALGELWPFGRRDEPRIFLRAEVSPERPYRGQLVTYRAYLYTQLPVTGLQATRLPTFTGFWVRETRPDEPQRRVLVGDRPFLRVPILVRHLVPLRPGRLEIDPLEVRLTTTEIERRGLFGRGEVRVDVDRATDRTAVRVEPLPPPPASFAARVPEADRSTTLVGPLRLEAALAPGAVAAGRGAVVTVVAEGRGHLEAAPSPPAPEVEGARVLPAQERPVEGEIAAGEAARAWEYLVVPERAGEIDLPPVEMPYFDPATGSYRLARADLPVLTATAPPPPPRDAAPPAAAAEREPAPAPWPWLAAFAAGVVAAGALLVGRGRRGRGRRLRGPAATAFDAELSRALGEERPRRAAAAFESAWRQLLEAVWQVPHEAPAGRWPAELAARGLPPERTRELARLVDDVHQLRHAPELASTGAAAEDIARRSRRLARGLGRGRRPRSDP